MRGGVKIAITREHKENFIKTIGEIAVKYNNVFYPSILIAKAIMETGWGESKVYKETNNLFSLRADEDWVGETYTQKCTEHTVEGIIKSEIIFRKYNNFEESIQDYEAYFYRQKVRFLDVIEAKSYKEQALSLNNIHTFNGNYGNKVARVIKSYRLHFFDDLNSYPDDYSLDKVNKLNKDYELVSLSYRGQDFIVRKVGYNDSFKFKDTEDKKKLEDKKIDVPEVTNTDTADTDKSNNKKPPAINWKVRVKSKAFWVALVPAIVYLISIVLRWFGIELDIRAISKELLVFIEAIFIVLVILGIVIDPTTEGVSDSERALKYDKPKDVDTENKDRE